MAANDYYNNTSYPPTGPALGHSTSSPHDRTDAPLPPLPGQQSQHAVSPASSPFEDHAYPPYPINTNTNTNSTTHSSGALGGYPDTAYHGPPQYGHNTFASPYDTPPAHGQHDPFADQNAIPLQSQPKMDGSPTRYNQDPERMYPAPEKKRRHKKKKEGWFSGRITWVVYILTVVQIGVFVGELIKNGMATSLQKD
jgi:hypothetical protein